MWGTNVVLLSFMRLSSLFYYIFSYWIFWTITFHQSTGIRLEFVSEVFVRFYFVFFLVFDRLPLRMIELPSRWLIVWLVGDRFRASTSNIFMSSDSRVPASDSVTFCFTTIPLADQSRRAEGAGQEEGVCVGGWVESKPLDGATSKRWRMVSLWRALRSSEMLHEISTDATAELWGRSPGTYAIKVVSMYFSPFFSFALSFTRPQQKKIKWEERLQWQTGWVSSKSIVRWCYWFSFLSKGFWWSRTAKSAMAFRNTTKKKAEKKMPPHVKLASFFLCVRYLWSRSRCC